MAVSSKLRNLYYNFFDSLETWCANMISDFQERKLLNKYMTQEAIPTDFKAKYKQFWLKYPKSGGVKFAWYYAAKNGILDPRYIPNDLYYTKIDQHFNDRKLGWGFNDKNYYTKIFNGVRQPKTVVRKINTLLFDANYHQLTRDEALCLITEETEVICKPTLETGSGRNIRFWNTTQDRNEIIEFLSDKSQADYIIQGLIRQHEALNKIHATSINSIRITSLLLDDGVHLLSSVLRMGMGGSRVDNATAGGVSCGIHPDGTLKERACTYYSGESFASHPDGVVYKGYPVPSYDKAVELVKSIHPHIAHFRLVSWDIAIGEDGEPILIEANMRKGGINLHQFSNGPLFGDLTERVLDEVFSVK